MGQHVITWACMSYICKPLRPVHFRVTVQSWYRAILTYICIYVQLQLLNLILCNMYNTEIHCTAKTWARVPPANLFKSTAKLFSYRSELWINIDHWMWWPMILAHNTFWQIVQSLVLYTLFVNIVQSWYCSQYKPPKSLTVLLHIVHEYCLSNCSILLKIA